MEFGPVGPFSEDIYGESLEIANKKHATLCTFAVQLIATDGKLEIRGLDQPGGHWFPLAVTRLETGEIHDDIQVDGLYAVTVGPLHEVAPVLTDWTYGAVKVDGLACEA